MAWTFILLVMLNGMFWGWEHFYNLTSSTPTPAVSVDQPPLTVLQGSTQTTSPSSPVNTTSIPSTAGTVFSCYLIGPLDAKEVGLYQKKIQAHHLVSLVRSEDVSNQMYMVYIPPFQYITDAQNMADRLRNEHIDALVLETGSYARAISLGKFYSETSADGLIQQITAKGINVEKRRVQSDRNMTWLFISPPSPQSSDVVGEWLQHQHGLHHESAPCN